MALANARIAELASVKGVTSVDAHIGGRIRLRRVTLSMSQNELAQAIGISFQQMQKYEIGENRISASRLYHIAITLDIPVQWFFEDLSAVAPASGATLDALRDAVELVKQFLQIRDAASRKRLLKEAAGIAVTGRNDVPAPEKKLVRKRATR